MCKVVSTIKEKQAMLSVLEALINEMNRNIEWTENNLADAREALKEAEQDESGNAYNIEYRKADVAHGEDTLKAYETVKKHLEKLI